MMAMGHNLYFYVSSKSTILFKGADTDSAGEIVLGVVIIFLVSLLYEILRKYKNYFEEIHFKKSRRTKRQSRNVNIELQRQRSESPDMDKNGGIVRHLSQEGIVSDARSEQHAADTVFDRVKYVALSVTLHMVSLVISYFVMLVVMTFNLWLFLAVILGSGCGKLLTFTLLKGHV